MLAELDANGVAFIVGAVVIGILQIVALVDSNWEKRAKIKREQELEDRAYEREKETRAALEAVVETVEVVHKATNSMHAAIVNAEKDASFRQGKAEEKAEEKVRVEEHKVAMDLPTVVVKVSEADGTPIPPDQKLQVGDTTEVSVDGGKQVIVHEDQAGEPARE